MACPIRAGHGCIAIAPKELDERAIHGQVVVMADQTKTPDLWTPRSVDETLRIYADWADTYENDVASMAYATPDRIAQAVGSVAPDPNIPVLDFGCGTGLSGMAMRRYGFTVIDGTDISPEMLAHAKTKTHDDKPLYRALWLGQVGSVNVAKGDYGIIIATGVVSLGAAPPSMLGILLDALAPDGLLAFSYNDPTLADATYMAALDDAIANGSALLEFRAHGPHLNTKVTGSDVIVLRRQ